MQLRMSVFCLLVNLVHTQKIMRPYFEDQPQIPQYIIIVVMIYEMIYIRYSQLGQGRVQTNFFGWLLQNEYRIFWGINSTIQFDPIHLPLLLYLFLSKASQADE